MQKNLTHLSSTHINNQTNSVQLKPSKKTIQNILDYAASYRVEKCADEHYIGYVLN